MPEPIDYFEGKRSDRIYVTRSFEVDIPFEGGSGRDARYISRVIDPNELHEFVQIKDQVIIRVTKGKRQEIKAFFYEDNRQIKHLTIQRYSRISGKPHKDTHFTFSGSEINQIIQLLKTARHITLEDSSKETLDDEILDDLFISGEDKRKFLLNNIELISEIVELNVTNRDITALAYRREQLKIFDHLLNDTAYIESRGAELGIRGKEAVWQRFFEDNPWIFGYGLNYVFMSELNDQKLEQITSGAYLSTPGKRIDALMKTRGLISSLCFVEIKTNETKLIDEKKPYRSGSWRVSNELTGSIAQIQRTMQLALDSIHSKHESTSKHGDPTGEIVFLYQPKAFVVIGSLEQFTTDFGINEEKYCSFELFRRNLRNPEIITFDELFSRAQFIIEHSNYEDQIVTDGSNQTFEEDIPF